MHLARDVARKSASVADENTQFRFGKNTELLVIKSHPGERQGTSSQPRLMLFTGDLSPHRAQARPSLRTLWMRTPKRLHPIPFVHPGQVCLNASQFYKRMSKPYSLMSSESSAAIARSGLFSTNVPNTVYSTGMSIRLVALRRSLPSPAIASPQRNGRCI